MKTKNTYIKDIRPGDKVVDTFLVTEKNLAYSQKGSPYLNLRLKDRTGELDGKVWDNASEWERVFNRGDVIRIHSRAVNYKNAVQLSVLSLQKVDEDAVDLADYFPRAKGDIEQMFSELMAFVDRIETPCLRALLDAFFKDEKTASLFKRAPAAKGFHHVYIGGLLEHTLSVTKLLDIVTHHYQGINRDLLLTGGILHDIGKIHEYSYNRTIDYSDEGRLIGHIVISLEMVDARIAGMDFPEQLAMELRHLILSHHGLLEFGSPKRPKTLEALIVHYIDDLDAKVNAFQQYIGGDPNVASDWTPFHRLFERFIYKGKGDQRRREDDSGAE
ncbi:MAG: HD domain-containing protein [Deltaproteobacteria bacterium]|nr:HD domain-containing protein [Deltaproteobacteria bacterium]